MQISLLENTTFDKVQAHVCQLNQQSLLNVLTRKEYISVKRVLLGSWSQIVEQIQRNGADLLFDVSDLEDFTHCLVDIGDLEINTKSLTLLKQVESTGDYQHLIIYSSQSLSLNAEQKKETKKLGLYVIDLKKTDSGTMLGLAEEYINQLGLVLSKTQVLDLVQNCSSYQQVVDTLDFVSLSGDPEAALQSLSKQPSIELFKLPFSYSGLSVTQVRQWSQLSQDELQLALSLVYGKLEKQGKPARSILRELIDIDYRIKTVSKTPALTWWKYFVFKQAA